MSSKETETIESKMDEENVAINNVNAGISASAEQKGTPRNASDAAINNRILNIFNEMAEYYETLPGMKHRFQAGAYHRAALKLEKYFRNNGNQLIQDVDMELSHIEGFGQMLKAHLKEIINSKHHTLLVHENVYNSESSIHAPTELQYQEGSFKIDGLKSLMTVRGIGPSTARALYGRGYTTIEKLVKEYHINKPILEGLLTHQQLICLEHYHDLQSTLKRKEVDEITLLLQSNIDNISHNHSDELHGQDQWVCEAVGEYRRGCKDMTEINILIYPTHSIKANSPIASNCNSLCIARYLLNVLKSINFIVEDIALPCGIKKKSPQEHAIPTILAHESDVECDYIANSMTDSLHVPNPTTSYQGICQIFSIHKAIANGIKSELLTHNAIHHLLLIHITPHHEIPFARLHYTGSNKFMRSMRIHAKQTGYTLNQHGLFTFHKEQTINREGQAHKKRLLDNQVIIPIQMQNGNQIDGGAKSPVLLPIHTDGSVVESIVEERDIFDYLNYPYVSPNDRNT